ncbi:MAG: DUF4397 domain-containing protein [Gammaproteobacteria bacterium]|nr:DUF4397 domain-containing protein [Gammaproteobacteria bacterium]
MNIREWKISSLFIALSAICLITGCNDDGDGDDELHDPVIGAFHAVSDMGTIAFMTGQDDDDTVWSQLEYGDGVVKTVDPEQYDINFDTALPEDDTDVCAGDSDEDGFKDDDECTRLAPGSINVLEGQEYLLFLYGGFEALEVLEYEKAYHEFDTKDEDEDGDPEDENMEVQFFHLSPALGNQVDIYLEPPGTYLSATQARGTLSLKEEFHALVDEDEYVLTLTAVGNPNTVYFTSEAFTLSRQTRVAFAICDGAGSGTFATRISLFRDQSGTLIDRNAETALRITHAVPDGDNADIYAYDNFADPFVANLAFSQASSYQIVSPSFLTDLSLDVTPAGNSGVFLAREEVDLTRGTQNTFFLVGESDDWDGLKLTDDNRRLATHSLLRLINGASSTLDFYVVEPNSNISTLSPTVSLTNRQNSGLGRLDPGTYDVALTTHNTSTVIYGPVTIDLSAGGLYSVIATDNTSDPTAADLVFLDDFVN